MASPNIVAVVFSLDFSFFVLNQATQKNICQFFLPNNIRESKISNPQKSLDHPRPLKSGVISTPLRIRMDAWEREANISHHATCAY